MVENVKEKANKIWNDNKDGVKSTLTLLGMVGGLVGIGYLFGRRATTRAVKTAMSGMHVDVFEHTLDVANALPE